MFFLYLESQTEPWIQLTFTSAFLVFILFFATCVQFPVPMTFCILDNATLELWSEEERTRHAGSWTNAISSFFVLEILRVWVPFGNISNYTGINWLMDMSSYPLFTIIVNGFDLIGNYRRVIPKTWKLVIYLLSLAR